MQHLGDKCGTVLCLLLVSPTAVAPRQRSIPAALLSLPLEQLNVSGNPLTDISALGKMTTLKVDNAHSPCCSWSVAKHGC